MAEPAAAASAETAVSAAAAAAAAVAALAVAVGVPCSSYRRIALFALVFVVVVAVGAVLGISGDIYTVGKQSITIGSGGGILFSTARSWPLLLSTRGCI